MAVSFCFLVLEFVISALFIILLLKLLQIINIFLKKSFYMDLLFEKQSILLNSYICSCKREISGKNRHAVCYNTALGFLMPSCGFILVVSYGTHHVCFFQPV